MKSIQFLVQAFLFVFEYLETAQEVFVFKLIGFKKMAEYKREGSCLQTAQCCKSIGVRIPYLFEKFKLTKNLFQKWYAFRFNFKFLHKNKDVLVYSCNYLTADNQCSIYKFRPKLCRDYPRTLLYGFIKVHKGCGYSFKKS